MKFKDQLSTYTKTLTAMIAVTALSALALPAYADVTVNGKLSTLGLGLEVAFPMISSVDARIGLNSFQKNVTQTSTSNGFATNYYGDLNLKTLEALADWHPFEGSFRLSGGLMYNKNNLRLTGLPSGGTINIGGTDYPVAPGEYVSAEVDFNKMAPYLGIGWGRTPKNSGLSFTSDIGVLFQGTPKGIVTTNIPGVAQSDLDQANSDLNDSIKNFKYYPVISIGIGYTF